MAKVSRYPLHKDIESRMFEIFRTVVALLNDHQAIEEFLNEFLSPVEKLMLAKRLSIAVLLAKNYNYEQISKILRVTPSTVARVSLSLKYSGNGYKKVIKKISDQEKNADFWNKISDLLEDSLPPPVRGNWSHYRREQWKKRRQREKAF